MKKSVILTASILIIGLLATLIVASPLEIPILSKTMRRIERPEKPIGYLGTIVRLSKGVTIDESFVNELRNKSADQVRVDHFAPLLKNPKIRFQGWDCEIKSVVNNDDSIVGTVAVMPLITCEGRSATAVGVLEEVYELKDGTLTFVKMQPRGRIGYIAN